MITVNHEFRICLLVSKFSQKLAILDDVFKYVFVFLYLQNLQKMIKFDLHILVSKIGLVQTTQPQQPYKKIVGNHGKPGRKPKAPFTPLDELWGLQKW